MFLFYEDGRAAEKRNSKPRANIFDGENNYKYIFFDGVHGVKMGIKLLIPTWRKLPSDIYNGLRWAVKTFPRKDSRREDRLGLLGRR